MAERRRGLGCLGWLCGEVWLDLVECAWVYFGAGLRGVECNLIGYSCSLFSQYGPPRHCQLTHLPQTRLCLALYIDSIPRKAKQLPNCILWFPEIVIHADDISRSLPLFNWSLVLSRSNNHRPGDPYIPHPTPPSKSLGMNSFREISVVNEWKF